MDRLLTPETLSIPRPNLNFPPFLTLRTIFLDSLSVMWSVKSNDRCA